MKKVFVASLALVTFLSCSRQQYVVSGMQAERHPVKISEGLKPNEEVNDLVNKYKTLLDKEMGQVIGKSSQDMTYGIPESLLTNLTSDVMLGYVRKSLERDCDLAIMNVNGHRSNLAKGNITLGNIFEIYSFENALTLVELKGDGLLKAFDSYARMGGYGISSTARLVIKDRKLVSASVDGNPIDKDKVYTIVTLDYLAEGNDGMQALKKAVNATPTGTTLRDVMLDYVKEETRQGHEITSVLDGRVTVEK